MTTAKVIALLEGKRIICQFWKKKILDFYVMGILEAEANLPERQEY